MGLFVILVGLELSFSTMLMTLCHKLFYSCTFGQILSIGSHNNLVHSFCRQLVSNFVHIDAGHDAISVHLCLFTL